MLKIKNIENWYGIKKLMKPELINKNTVLYAPNGVMKSSFADGIRNVVDGENPRDVFSDIDGIFELEFNGVSITNDNNTKGQLNAIVFGGSDIKSEIYSNPEISKLLLSQTLKSEYEAELKKSKNIRSEIKNIISVDIAGENKYVKSTVSLLIDVSNEGKEIESMLDFIESIYDDVIDNDLTGISFKTVFGENGIKILSTPELTEKITKYNEVVKKGFDENFSKGFTFDNLLKINSALVQNKFYDAGHTINLLDKKYNQDELNKYIEEVKKNVFGSDEVKQIYDEIKKIDSVKKNDEVKELINNNQWVLSYINDMDKFKQKYVNTKAKPVKDKLLELKKELIETQKKIEEIFIKAKSEKTHWDKVFELYNKRFYNKNFKLEIENIKDQVLGINTDVIVSKKLKQEDIEITNEIEERLSSGEKRAIYILSLIYEIELAKISGDNFCIVLDDIVDSFDYKNKYSMIEYLKDLANNPKIQLIIMTHNFDFYRSCRLSLKNIDSKLLAYEKNGIVELIDARNEEFETMVFLKNWRSQQKEKSVIGLVPLIRNLVEISEGSRTSNYALLCHFLHYDNDTDSLTLGNLQTIFNNYQINIPSNLQNSNYVLTLNMVANEIINNGVREDKLIDKIVLGIFIRVASDKLLYNIYLRENGGNKPSIQSGNWTQGLYDLVKDKIDENEKLYIVLPQLSPLHSFT